jgi:hypothetical protein
MSLKASSSRYARYNLGIALLKLDGTPRSIARGMAILDDVGRMPAENEEFRPCATGPTSPSASPRSAKAIRRRRAGYLERVRLKSLQANKALLGFGWAADSLKDPKLALVPWLELAGRDVGDSAGARGAHRRALRLRQARRLRPGARPLQRRDRRVRAGEQGAARVDRALRSPKWIDAMIDANPGDEMGWFWRLGDLPECRMPRTCRRCWRSTSSRRRSRTTATCATWRRTSTTGRASSAPSTTCWRPGEGLRRQAAAGAGACRRHRHRAAGKRREAIADEIAKGRAGR